MIRSHQFSFLAGLALAGLLALFVFLWLSARQDRASAVSLAQAHTQIAALKAENAHLVVVLSSLTNLSLPLDNDALEISRLKAEIAALRGQKEVSAPALATNLPQTAAQAFALNADADAQTANLAGLPQDTWRFSGYETAADAFESLLWAMKNGDVDAFRSSLTPEAQQTMARAFAGLSDTDIAIELQNEVSDLSVLRLDRAIQLADDEVSFIIFSTQADGDESQAGGRVAVTFKNTGGEWKSTGLY